ncbi:MAG: amylo-alpha-1,6-glucosidase [Acidobacteriota bacterium]
MSEFVNREAEWLEPDGLGGFASGTVNTIRTRRYHGLLLVATTPPTGRKLLVNGFEAWVEGPGGRQFLSVQRYAPDTIYPDGHRRIVGFARDPWPCWTYRLDDGTEVVQEIWTTPPHARTIVRWTVKTAGTELGDLSLAVRPLLSGRDYHALHGQNNAFAMATERRADGLLRWRPYSELPVIVSATNGRWSDDPAWFRQFLYAAERERGLDCQEDLASPGILRWRLGSGPALWVMGTEPAIQPLASTDLVAEIDRAAAAERDRRARLGGPLARAADAYLVRRGIGKTIVAGYPWFTDWGRDTFISLRGLCLATGRLDEVRDILLEWSHAISRGMVPNRFPDAGEEPEYNSVDASLWFVIAARELLAAAPSPSRLLSSVDRLRLESAIDAILDGYARGTRYGIRCADDGLLQAGEPGVQLTWMDARVGGREITPRIGKPVEIQALWVNALEAGAAISSRWPAVLARARASFEARFWNEEAGCLFDVVDVDHVAGQKDPRIRPNQILAVGGLPTALLEGERARRVVDLVERVLWTPLGLRTLAPGTPGYAPHYEGGPDGRDGAYHQGTAWPWLLGPFVDAWVRVRGGTDDARREARERFLAPVLAHLDDAGLGHVSEIVDADPPHTPRGCPFQAWSLGELIRIDRLVGGGR